MRAEIEMALTEIMPPRRETRPSALQWRPISSLPERMKDGRYLLFWEVSGPVVARWCERGSPEADRSFWSTGFASPVDGDLVPVTDALYWAEFAEPRLWPRAVPDRPAGR